MGTGVYHHHHRDLSTDAGLLLTIEVSAVAFGGGLSLPANTHWEQVPATLPVIIFTLVYHDIAPGTYPRETTCTVRIDFHACPSCHHARYKAFKVQYSLNQY